MGSSGKQGRPEIIRKLTICAITVVKHFFQPTLMFAKKDPKSKSISCPWSRKMLLLKSYAIFLLMQFPVLRVRTQSECGLW
jgi:hypothetical protein